MIKFESVSKYYPSRRGSRLILNDINLTIKPCERIGILGGNGAGKSTLLRLIGGVENPSRGRITRSMTTSWPLAFHGGFQGALTGLDNLKFICRIYGVDPKDRIDFIEDFSELGPFLNEPVQTYSSGMRARLAFSLSLCIDFECLLIDEVVAVGDARFREKCIREIFMKRKDKALIIVSHDAPFIQAHCDKASVLSQGQLKNFDTVEEGLNWYSTYLMPTV